jgi:hypothetical protein
MRYVHGHASEIQIIANNLIWMATDFSYNFEGSAPLDPLSSRTKLPAMGIVVMNNSGGTVVEVNDDTAL